MSIVTQLLVTKSSQRIFTSEEERLRALRLVCSALPRTAQALHEQVRRPSCAQANRHDYGHQLVLHLCSALHAMHAALHAWHAAVESR